MTRTIILAILLAFGVGSAVWAQTEATPEVSEPEVSEPSGPEPHMDLQTMAGIVSALDPEAVVSRNSMQLTVDNVPVTIVMDVLANRMRILVPIASAQRLDADDLMRLMQANFDTALDARYAVANGRLWSVFIHPLAQLERAQFVSGLAQTVTLARNFGGSYSSGGVVFGGGDSGALFQELLDKSEEI